MNLSQWKKYVTPNETSILLSTIPASDHKHPFSTGSVLHLTGESGHLYLLPHKVEDKKGSLKTYSGGAVSGCLWTCFHKQAFPELSEIRIYCLMSQKDICKKGVCYVAALRGDRRVSLLKYTQGLQKSPETLLSLRLPTEYTHGMFGLLWAYYPEIRPGIFFRCMLNLRPFQTAQGPFRLFEYLETQGTFSSSKGEGIGVSSFDTTQTTHVSFARTEFHTLFLTDPQEDVSTDDNTTITITV